MKIAYLVNQYPQASHSFIRREIAGVQQLGIDVERFTVRRWSTPLVDEADIEEQRRTRAILETPPARLLLNTCKAVLAGPVPFLRALRLAVRTGLHSDRGLPYHLVYLVEAATLREWLKRENVQHVHAHFGTNSAAVAMLCAELGGPSYSFTVHGPDEFDAPELLSLGKKIQKAAFVVGISDFGKSQLFRWCSFDQWRKVKVVHCGVDAAFLATEPDPIPAAPRLVCVGRLSEAKGQPLLIEAAARLKREGLKFEIVLAGGGPMQAQIEELIARNDVGDCVRLLGWVSNVQVREELRRSRAMVLPSFAEGLPVAIMEALAMGRPVIASRIAGIPELVETGTCGWLITPGSVEALSGALRDAITADVGRLTEMGRRGRALVQERHDASKEAAKLKALFEQVFQTGA